MYNTYRARAFDSAAHTHKIILPTIARLRATLSHDAYVPPQPDNNVDHRPTKILFRRDYITRVRNIHIYIQRGDCDRVISRFRCRALK